MALPAFSEAANDNPAILFLFSQTKVGKTTLLSALPDNLIIDTEEGSKFVGGIKYDLMKRARELNRKPEDVLKGLAQQIIKANRELGEGRYVYDYISIDTTSGLESIARKMATDLYKATVVGKNFKGVDVVTELEMGGGYGYLRRAFEILYGYFKGISKHGLILSGHTKSASIKKDGKDLSAIDIDLTGKLKSIVSADADAIGILTRNKENPNQVIVSFKTDLTNLASGARPRHLQNKEFVLSELNDDGSFTFNWDKIYLTK